ncbi:MAG: hypothetical protein HPY80_04050 [Bacteroidales bacterium]|jgi:TolA-binding protein|nr:hypothetical protein [Bacteroidales bacterium]NPV35827.1 hypothetical protein [Bacteroidales bacterium]
MKTNKLKVSLFLAFAAIIPTALQAQESACKSMPKYGKDSVQCVTNLSLYREPVKQKNYQDAYKPWKWVYENCPCASQFIYVDGIKIQEFRMTKASDPQVKQNIIDSLLGIYDARIKYFPKDNRGRSQVGNILTRKAIDAFTYNPNRPEDAYNYVKQAIELDGAEVLPEGLQLYLQSAIKMVELNKAEKTIVVDAYDQLSDLMDNAMQIVAGDTNAVNKYLVIKNNIESLFEPFATCEDLVNIYQSKFDANPNDIDLLRKITKILEKKKCTDKDLFFAATENLHKLEPSASSAYMMAVKNMKEENWSQAAKYLNESISLFGTEDVLKKEKAYLMLGQVYLAQRNYTAAKSTALKMLETNPYDGNALILLGDAYAFGASTCGDNELSKRAGYWAAVDKYIQARKVDPEVAETANKRIATYSAYFPSIETIFFHGFKEGESYRVECWINETTTVRASR